MNNQQYVLSKGATLAVETQGDGAPVVFLHTAVTDQRMWHTEMKGVASSRFAISYDRRGFGETIAGNEDYSSVADLLAVLNATSGRAPAVLVGCSQGGADCYRCGVGASGTSVRISPDSPERHRGTDAEPNG